MLKYFSNEVSYHFLIDNIKSFFKTSAHMFICIDYIPLSLFEGTLCYGVLDKSFSITFRPSFASYSRCSNALRKSNIGVIQLLAGIKKAATYLSGNNPSSDAIKAIRTLLDTRRFEEICNYMYDTNQHGYNKQLTAVNSELVSSLAYLEERDWASSSEAIQKLCDKIVKILSDYTNEPDTLDDLLGYAALSTGNLEGDYAIRYIPELSALNIITPYLTDIKQHNHVEYDKHMFFANCEMLKLFTHRLPVGGCRFPQQNTFSLLTEYVPVAMKFKDIYNPLFDTAENLWEQLCKSFKWMQTIECCDNRCSLSGARIDNSTTLYSPSNPDTYNQSRIYYGLCCDMDQAFNRDRTPIVPAKDLAGGVVYSPDLAAALLYRMLLNRGNSFLKANDLAGTIAWYEDSSDDRCYISLCTSKDKPLFATPYNKIAHKDFVYTMIYRTLLTNDSKASFDPDILAKDAGQMEAQFNSITLNTFGGF